MAGRTRNGRAMFARRDAMKGRTALFKLGGLAGMLLLAGCEAFDTDVRVEYQVQSDAAQVGLLYKTEFGQDDRRVEAPPFAYRADFPKGVVVGIGAQSLDAEPRSVSCQLFIEGDLVDEDSAEGPNASVLCSAVTDN